MPVPAAAVDTREGERLGARGHRLGQHVLHATFHHAGGRLALAVQRDDGPDGSGDPRWPGDTPFGADAAARRGDERAGGNGTVGAGREGAGAGKSGERGTGTSSRAELE